MKSKPDLSFWKLWNLSFGFFGVQIAYALQSSQVSRIFSTIGADPHDLSYFWILPPLMGLVVQPIVGAASDKTWNRFGRRLPYLLIGALVAIVVMCFLPNSGSLGLGVSQAIIFGLVMLMFLDTSINMAMQPFKMLVGDFVNEKQKGLAYSIQSFLCNAGSVVGYIAPIVLAVFLSNTAPAGEVPPTVTWAFYIGAAVLLLCVIYTFAKVKEMPPHEYAMYQGSKAVTDDTPKEKANVVKLLARAPKVFWTVGIVQFFCWAAFLYMWTYSTDAIAGHAFGAPSTDIITGLTIDGKEYNDKYIFNGQRPVIHDGRLAIGGIEVDGQYFEPSTVVIDGDTVIARRQVVYSYGVPKAPVAPSGKAALAGPGQTVIIDNMPPVSLLEGASTISELSLIQPGTDLTLAHIAIQQPDGEYALDQTNTIPAIEKASQIDVNYSTVLNASSQQYQNAGDWNGVLLAIQAIAAVLWAVVLAQFKKRKPAYSISLLIGAIGFASVFFITDKYLLGISYALMGCAWAAMLAMPFTILTNALAGDHIGTYLGLFNCTICIPQIIAALCGGAILHCFAPAANGAPATVWMLVVSGILMLIGSVAVWNIKETFGSQTPSAAKPADAITES
ncbi:MAG: MFS transporter [Muribaculaceae bacterium]|nr:MFS transporter [Muribaculaceae bacterium]